jgi:RNA polymerase sigma-70 factor, ECF subfamily
MDDDTLMARAAQDDTAAFGAIVRRYERRMTAFAERLLGDPDLAQDAVQEAFLHVWQARARYEARGCMVHYLLRVVRSACLDHLRRDRVRRAAAQAAERGAAAPDPVGARAERSATAAAARRAVLSLPTPQREVFVLSHYECLTYVEIADLLGCPVGTVASRKRLAVAALREALREWTDG